MTAVTVESARLSQADSHIGGGAGVPRKIFEALDKNRWHEFALEDIRLIDNILGFTHREHFSPSSGD